MNGSSSLSHSPTPEKDAAVALSLMSMTNMKGQQQQQQHQQQKIMMDKKETDGDDEKIQIWNNNLNEAKLYIAKNKITVLEPDEEYDKETISNGLFRWIKNQRHYYEFTNAHTNSSNRSSNGDEAVLVKDLILSEYKLKKLAEVPVLLDYCQRGRNKKKNKNNTKNAAPATTDQVPTTVSTGGVELSSLSEQEDNNENTKRSSSAAVLKINGIESSLVLASIPSKNNNNNKRVLNYDVDDKNKRRKSIEELDNENHDVLLPKESENNNILNTNVNNTDIDHHAPSDDTNNHVSNEITEKDQKIKALVNKQLQLLVNNELMDSFGISKLDLSYLIFNNTNTNINNNNNNDDDGAKIPNNDVKGCSKQYSSFCKCLLDATMNDESFCILKGETFHNNNHQNNEKKNKIRRKSLKKYLMSCKRDIDSEIKRFVLLNIQVVGKRVAHQFDDGDIYYGEITRCNTSTTNTTNTTNNEMSDCNWDVWFDDGDFFSFDSKEMLENYCLYEEMKNKEFGHGDPEKMRERKNRYILMKSNFYTEKVIILSQIPHDVQRMFYKLGYATYQKKSFPVFFLGPYDVSPGPVRENYIRKHKEHMSNFKGTHIHQYYDHHRDERNNEKLMKRKQFFIDDFPILVYWFGQTSFDDAFSIVSYQKCVLEKKQKYINYIHKPPQLLNPETVKGHNERQAWKDFEAHFKSRRRTNNRNILPFTKMKEEYEEIESGVLFVELETRKRQAKAK